MLERAEAGDRAAVEMLFAGHRDYLRQMIDLRMNQQLRSRIDVSDVIQEAHVEAVRPLADFLRRRPMPFSQLNEPSMQPLRNQLLARALEYFQGMVAVQSDDPKADADLAADFARIGRIKSTTGSINEAIEAYQKSVELFDKLVRTEPNVPKHQEDLVLVLNSLGQLLLNNGRFEEARRHLDRAVSIAERFLSEQSWRHANRAGTGGVLQQSGLSC